MVGGVVWGAAESNGAWDFTRRASGEVCYTTPSLVAKSSTASARARVGPALPS